MIDRDDLISVGSAAVGESLQRFDPSRSIRFNTFATQRIRGAMLDEMRNADPLSRTHRRRIASRGETFAIASIEAKRDDGKNIHHIADDAPPPDARARLLEDFRVHLASFSSVERSVLELRFVEDLTMKEIGRAIGLTESRISQMLASMIARLRARLTMEDRP